MKLFVLLARDNPFTTTWELPPFLNTQVDEEENKGGGGGVWCASLTLWIVVADVSVVKVDPKPSLQKLCLLGCGITTGFGAATKTVKVTENDSVAVFGVGCIGLSVIQAAAANKAK